MVAGGAVGVSETAECYGFEADVRAISGRRNGLLETVDRSGMVAETQVCVTERVPYPGNCGALDFGGEPERVRAGGEGFRVVPQLGMAPPDPVQGVGLPPEVAGRSVELQCLLGVSERLGQATLRLEQSPERQVGR